ncbi:helix-turn-helix domain-containing protein [Lactococcus protaetiae]|uniref:Helix-turn-helix transcriptional regulator n=1 Tax=Lactococcus protaetiae TaxID=2592653 RepID=A0A514ZA78_9LACT|nr:helix-turn-helix transcriptional regulator [Lactococcus protaetiae]QDK71490.1 helix-turn-helix transcriptional regulator [Lactococcus protaetiae]
MTVLDRIKILAKKRDKTIKEIAFDIGLSENSLYRFDKSIPNGQTLQKLADYFGVTVDYLLGREEKPFPSETDLSEMIDRSNHFDGKEYPDEVKQGMKDVLRAYLMGRLDNKEN